MHIVGKHIKKLFLYRNNCHPLIKNVWGCGDAPTCEGCYTFLFFEFLKWHRILLSRWKSHTGTLGLPLKKGDERGWNRHISKTFWREWPPGLILPWMMLYHLKLKLIFTKSVSRINFHQDKSSQNKPPRHKYWEKRLLEENKY